jgi:SAM-dependent methyltransferase
MSENEAFWDFFWEVRLQALEDLGKREAILAISKLIRDLAERQTDPLRVLELGCGEGQIIGALLSAHAQDCSLAESCGVDFSHRAIMKCRHDYPDLTFLMGDFTDPELLAGLGEFEIVIFVNALHEVYSNTYSEALQAVDVPRAKAQVEQALASAVARLTPGGTLVIFDGLEPAGDLQGAVHIQFQHWPARRRFESFVREYRPFQIKFQQTADPMQVELTLRDFTRYITKSIFLEKHLWETERLESYQYFNQDEFLAALAPAGLELIEVRTLTVNYEKWRSEVEIKTPGMDFPAEHILLLARKPV